MPVREVPESKVCRRCNEEKAASDFRSSSRMKSGLESYCRECAIAKSAEWRALNPERRKELEAARTRRTTEERWAVGLWVNYRIRPADYWLIHQQQNGKCAICGELEPRKRGMLHVDHCHDSNRVRGLLCQNCNFALGHMRDRTDLLRRAIEYLEAN